MLNRTVPFMVIGVVFAEFIVAMGVVDMIAYLARPISNFANLRDECGVGFMTAFIMHDHPDLLCCLYPDNNRSL